jgi:hypothetical protein
VQTENKSLPNLSTYLKMMNNPQKSLTSAVVQLIQAAYLVAPALVILIIILAVSITLLVPL